MKVVDRRDCSELVQDMSPWDARMWSGGKQLLCILGQNGSVTLLLPVKTPGKAQLNMYATMSYDFGKVQAFLDDKPVGQPFDAFGPVVVPSGMISLGRADMKEGDHRLRFDVVGKNDASTGFRFGLDCVEITP